MIHCFTIGIIWFIYYENMTRFIPRIDPDGNILQIMATGAYSLNSIDFMSFLEILSETEFMMIQFLWRSVNGISIFSNSACDVSVLRLTTTPKVQFNLMIDYNTSFDGVIEMHVLENTWYIMWINIPTFIAFSYFPIDEALIDTNEIKNKTLFYEISKLLWKCSILWKLSFMNWQVFKNVSSSYFNYNINKGTKFNIII